MPNRLTKTPPASRSQATSNEQRKAFLSSPAPPRILSLRTHSLPSTWPMPAAGPLLTRPMRASRPSVAVPRRKEPRTSHGLHLINVARRSIAEGGIASRGGGEEEEEEVAPCGDASAAIASSGEGHPPGGEDTLKEGDMGKQKERGWCAGVLSSACTRCGSNSCADCYPARCFPPGDAFIRFHLLRRAN